MRHDAEVAIIGAGPAGAVAAALLNKRGHKVVVLEQSHFPRFSIGESLLPQCMEFVEEAGMTREITSAGFQYKNGAAFVRDGQKGSFDFRDKFTPGPATTFQVQRARFDQILADSAAGQGADVRFGQKIIQVQLNGEGESTLTIEDGVGDLSTLTCRFLLDASGFGRVLPRLLDLGLPSDFPVRQSVFTHIEDNIRDCKYDRDKILIAIHPHHPDVWFWLIPFNNGRCSLGVVAETEYFERDAGKSPEFLLRRAVAESQDLALLLADARFDTPVQSIKGYASNVKSLHGNGFALLGNAGEFLDPVFSSGVTIAMKSASLAAPLVSRQLSGEPVDWEAEYARPLKKGVDTFRAYVNSWYDGTFQQVIFSKNQSPVIRAMICSILAGYAWDTENPYVREPGRRLGALVSLCAET